MLKGGGRSQGPVLRWFEFDLPKKVKWKALKVVLSARFLEGNLHIIDTPTLDSHKTQPFVDNLRDNWQLDHVILIHAYGELDPNLGLAARNVQGFDFTTARSANVYDLVKRKQIIVTEKGIAAFFGAFFFLCVCNVCTLLCPIDSCEGVGGKTSQASFSLA